MNKKAFITNIKMRHIVFTAGGKNLVCVAHAMIDIETEIFPRFLLKSSLC